MKKIILLWLVVIINLVGVKVLYGGLDFLKIPKNPRHAVLKSTAIADISFANPASLADLDSFLSVSHNSWLLDIDYENINFCWCILKDKLNIGSNIGYLHIGNIEEIKKIDILPNYEKTNKSFTAKDYLLTFGIGLKPLSKLNIGMNIKYIVEELSKYSIKILLYDVGIIYRIKDNLRLGICYKNLSLFKQDSKFINEDISIPLELKAGISYKSKFGLYSLDFHNLNNKNSVSIGMEYNLFKVLFLRLGYDSRLTKKAYGKLDLADKVLTGFGLKISNIIIDFAFLPYGELDKTWLASIYYRF
jgi:hypothetical protein